VWGFSHDIRSRLVAFAWQKQNYKANKLNKAEQSTISFVLVCQKVVKNKSVEENKNMIYKNWLFYSVLQLSY
jgi:hypothetical protein